MEKGGGGGVGRVMFLGSSNSTLDNHYVVGAGVGRKNASVRRALKRRASNNAQGEPCGDCPNYVSEVEGLRVKPAHEKGIGIHWLWQPDQHGVIIELTGHTIQQTLETYTYLVQKQNNNVPYEDIILSHSEIPHNSLETESGTRKSHEHVTIEVKVQAFGESENIYSKPISIDYYPDLTKRSKHEVGFTRSSLTNSQIIQANNNSAVDVLNPNLICWAEAYSAGDWNYSVCTGIYPEKSASRIPYWKFRPIGDQPIKIPLINNTGAPTGQYHTWENPKYYKYQSGAPTGNSAQYKIGVFAYDAKGEIYRNSKQVVLDPSGKEESVPSFLNMFNVAENKRTKWASGIFMPSCIPANMTEKPYFDNLKNDGRISDLYWNLDNAWELHNQQNTNPYRRGGSGGDILNVLPPSCSQYNLPPKIAPIFAHWRLGIDPIPIRKKTSKLTLKGGPYCETFSTPVIDPTTGQPNKENPQNQVKTALPDNPNLPVTGNVITYFVTSMIAPSTAMLNKIDPMVIKVDPASGIPANAEGYPIYPGETILPKNGGIISVI